MKTESKSKLLNFLKVDSLVDSILQYFEKRIELVKLEIKEESSVIGAKILINLIIGFLLLFFLLFLSLLASMLINEIYESKFLGEAVVAGFYIFLVILIQVLRKTANLDARIEFIIYKLLTGNKHRRENEDE